MIKQIIKAVAGFSLLTLLTVMPQAGEPKLNELAVKAPHRLLMDIKKIGDSRLVSVGERGHILISDDHGKSWQQKLIPTNVLLTKLFFVNDNIGWAVGHQQTILKTSDRGETWVLQHSSKNLAQPALLDIWFKDQLSGFAVGAYGLYLKTLDGGNSWETVYQEALENQEIGFPHFYSITFDRTNNQLFMAGEFGFLASSKDFGDTWQLLESPYGGSFFNIVSLSNQDLLAMGLRGHLFRSTDFGESWTEVKTGIIAGLQEALDLGDGKILIVGSDGTQLLSNDFGQTTRLIQRQDRVHLASAVNLSKDEFLVVGINGVTQVKLN